MMENIELGSPPAIPQRFIVELDQGLPPAMAVAAIRASGTITSPFHLKGYWHLVNFWCRFFPTTDSYCVIRLNIDSLFRFHLADPYWSRMLSANYEYELEVHRVLSCLKRKPYVMIDCGANFGYWSILASSQEFGNNAVYAIEPSCTTFAALQENNRLNGDRFKTFSFAVSDHNHTHLDFLELSDHASRKLLKSESANSRLLQPVSKVGARTIDSFVSEIEADLRGRPLVIKLDVEGSEIPAMRGAADTLKNRDVLLVYEDHGNDPSSKVSAYLLKELGWKVFYCRCGKRPQQIFELDELHELKRKRTIGYNLFAMAPNSQFSDLFQAK